MIALLLANGFEEAEALVPCDFLRRAGLDVRLVSIYDTPKVTGGHGICVQCDLCLKELGDLPQAVILPGGLGGVQELAASPACQKLVKDCYRAQGVIGAICAAPTLLSAWGLTDDKNLTCYPDMQDQATCRTWQNSPCVTDGRLVTSMAAGTASEFAFALIEVLKDVACAQEVARQVYFPR